MLESTRLRQEELRLQNEINDLPEVRLADDRGNAEEYETAERRRNESIGKLAENRRQIIAALQTESDEAQIAVVRNVDPDGLTAAQREYRDMAQACDIAVYIRSAAQGTELRDGAEFEYNKHVLNTFGIGDYPLEMLLQASEFDDLPAGVLERLRGDDPTVEWRTEITGVQAGSQNNTYLDRLLANSEGTYLRATYPSVGPGRHTYPVVTGTGVAATRTRGTAETAAGGIATEDADPARIQHSYEIASVDELTMPGIGAYMASDLRNSLMAGLDNKVVDDLISALTAIDVTSGTTLTFAGMLGGVYALVDGRGARYFNEIRLLAGNTSASSQTTAFSRIGALLAAVTVDAHFSYLASIRASAHMTAASGGEDNIIAVKTGAAPPRLIVPVWRRGQLLRDTGRLQLAGTVTLTGVMFADVILANADLHTQLRVETQ